MRDGLRIADLLALHDCPDRLLANVVARNEIMERAGLELLGPDTVLADATAIAERILRGLPAHVMEPV